MSGFPYRVGFQGVGVPLPVQQIAESMGFKGSFRQWEGLLRIGD